MKKYNTILFDIDDTLFDFGKDQEIAFKKAMKELGHICSHEMYQNYDKINRTMWDLLAKGEIKLEELYLKRFEQFFKQYGIKEEPQKLNQLLDKTFQLTGTPIEGATQVLQEVHGKYELAITSNGPKMQQYHRLKNAGYGKYFTKVFISEEIGFHKPEKEFFDIVFENIKTKDKSQILIVGDSLVSDIKGGKEAGIDTCWFHSSCQEIKTEIIPTYEITKLEQVIKILE